MSARIKASERRQQFMKYITEGKVDDGYYVIDRHDGKAIQIRRSKVKPIRCDVEVQTDVHDINLN